MFSRAFAKIKSIKHARSVGLGVAAAATLGVTTVHANEERCTAEVSIRSVSSEA